MKNFKLIFTASTIAKNNQSSDTFLSVDQAFKVKPQTINNQVKVTFNIIKGHYIYRDKIKLVLPKGVKAGYWRFNQKSSKIDDPKFGKVAVFDQSTVTATTTLINTTNKAISNQPIQLKWQGCAKAGLCYPPEKVTFKINLANKAKKKVKH